MIHLQATGDLSHFHSVVDPLGQLTAPIFGGNPGSTYLINFNPIHNRIYGQWAFTGESEVWSVMDLYIDAVKYPHSTVLGTNKQFTPMRLLSGGNRVIRIRFACGTIGIRIFGLLCYATGGASTSLTPSPAVYLNTGWNKLTMHYVSGSPALYELYLDDVLTLSGTPENNTNLVDESWHGIDYADNPAPESDEFIRFDNCAISNIDPVIIQPSIPARFTASSSLALTRFKASPSLALTKSKAPSSLALTRYKT